MDLGLEDKTALVAASSKGLGKACAKRLTQEGANVALCARNQSTLEETANELREKTDAGVISVTADVTKEADIDTFIKKTRDAFGHIDITLANAGGPPVGEFEDFDDDDWQNAFKLNLLSSVRLARKTLPTMAERGWGRVIFITSIAVKEPLDGFVLSNSVRTGVEGLAKTLANNYTKHGVTVNCALPGYTQTQRLEDIPDEEYNQLVKTIPAERLGQPDEFADVVAFLSSDRASYISGASIQVDGGFINSLF